MAKLHDQWTILPHGPLREIDDRLLTVVGQIPMPLGNFPRRMTVVGLAGNRTALFRIPLVTIAGTADREAALLVRRPGGASLILNDIIAHVANPQGFGAWLMSRLFGFGARRPAVPRPIRAKLVDDPPSVAWQFEKWAAIEGLRRIIPSHGEIIDDQPAAELLRLAQTLKR